MNRYLSRRDFLATAGVLGVAAGMSNGASILAMAADAAGHAAPHAEQLGWRLACCTYSFNRLTFYETIGKAASLGLKYVVGFDRHKLDPSDAETMLGDHMSAAQRRETKKRLGDAGVQLACCYCNDLAQEDACRRMFDFAKDMDIETLDGEPPCEAFDMLEMLCDEYHINVAVHNHAKPTRYWKPETLLNLFQGRSRRIGACCDTGHWARSGLNPVETLRKLEGRILTFDLKDVDEKGICVPFGTGKANIRGILDELHRQKFHGVFGIEYDQQPVDIEQDLAQCIAYFDKVAKDLSAN